MVDGDAPVCASHACDLELLVRTSSRLRTLIRSSYRLIVLCYRVAAKKSAPATSASVSCASFMFASFF
jgi:hypothetical protein